MIEERKEIQEQKPVRPRGNPNLVKGVSGNPAGKPKGIVPKVTKEVREMLNSFIQGKGLPDLFERFENMNDRLKVDFITKILPFVLPTLSAQKNEVDITNGTGKIQVKISYGDNEIEQEINNQSDEVEEVDYDEVDLSADFK